MTTTIYQLENNFNKVGKELEVATDRLTNMASSPSFDGKAITEQQNLVNELELRYDIVKKSYESAKAASDIENKARTTKGDAGVAEVTKMSAQAVRDVFNHVKLDSSKIQNVLATGNTTGGENTLPVNRVGDFLTEPVDLAPDFEISKKTFVTNLEIPTVSATAEGIDFIADTDAAQSVNATAGLIQFGRHKVKLNIKFAESVMKMSDLKLVNWANEQLKVAFGKLLATKGYAKTPKVGEEYLSYFTCNIPEVEYTNLIEGIQDATDELHVAYQAKCDAIVNKKAYRAAKRALSLTTNEYNGLTPEEVLGVRKVYWSAFVDTAIIGDFEEYSHYNFDTVQDFETGKDIETGISMFVYTTYFDHKVTVPTAFRILKLKVG